MKTLIKFAQGLADALLVFMIMTACALIVLIVVAKYRELHAQPPAAQCPAPSAKPARPAVQPLFI